MYVLNDSWQFGITIPLLIRKTNISYTLLDGSDYTPPYAGIHHRNETLMGLGDLQLSARYIYWWNKWGIMPELRSSIPTGKIEENPYLRAQESEVHQHLQMGSGTFVPSLAVTLFLDELQWGMLHTLSHEFPLYENTQKYLPGTRTTWSLGYWKRITPKFVLMGQLRGKHEAPERWMDLAYGGQDSISLNLASLIRVHPQWELGIQIEKNIWIQSRVNEEEPLNPGIIWNLSITY